MTLNIKLPQEYIKLKIQIGANIFTFLLLSFIPPKPPIYCVPETKPNLPQFISYTLILHLEADSFNPTSDNDSDATCW